MSLSDKLIEHGFPKAFTFVARPELLRQRNVPKPLHGVAPRVVLGQEWWDRERRTAYRSTQYRCAACGVDAGDARESQKLEAHEVYDVDYAAGRMVYVESVPLCSYCHSFIHCGRLRMLMESGEITLKKHDAVMRHGRKVLKAAKLKPQGRFDVEMAAWKDWRLVIAGKEYPPIHKNYDAWLRYFVPADENGDDDFYNRLDNQDGE